jgi:hypothetical protein
LDRHIISKILIKYEFVGCQSQASKLDRINQAFKSS